METIAQSAWAKSKLLIKALIIGLIVLLLQIPTVYVKDLISEREKRQSEAVEEVTAKWAKKQSLAGPVLVVPYSPVPADSGTGRQMKRFAYFLPDELHIRSEITPEEKHRGIYKVMLYHSKNNLKGSFTALQHGKLKIDSTRLQWADAFLQVQLSDLKGLNEEVKLKWNNQSLQMNTISGGDGSQPSAVNSSLNLRSADDVRNAQFSIDVEVRGSDEILFAPAGATTTVDLRAKWPHPSFVGDALPFSTDIKNDSFSARWKTIARDRSVPQQWAGETFESAGGNTILPADLRKNAFGASLFVPVNGYQKTMRSIKYAALCLLLTFAAFFLIETTNQKAVHPFQYGLIGLALVLFYTLLLSFSEYAGFDAAYVIASLFTIGLIGWFVKGLLQSGRLSIILTAVLFLIYTYVFTILQLQDYSLILGSLGLFITLGVIMHFSRKIQW